jgi:hypothetical protein
MFPATFLLIWDYKRVKGRDTNDVAFEGTTFANDFILKDEAHHGQAMAGLVKLFHQLPTVKCVYDMLSEVVDAELQFVDDLFDDTDYLRGRPAPAATTVSPAEALDALVAIAPLESRSLLTTLAQDVLASATSDQWCDGWFERRDQLMRMRALIPTSENNNKVWDAYDAAIDAAAVAHIRACDSKLQLGRNDVTKAQVRGHILYLGNRTLDLLGLEPLWPEATESPVPFSKAMSLHAHLAHFERASTNYVKPKQQEPLPSSPTSSSPETSDVTSLDDPF